MAMLLRNLNFLHQPITRSPSCPRHLPNLKFKLEGPKTLANQHTRPADVRTSHFPRRSGWRSGGCSSTKRGVSTTTYAMTFPRRTEDLCNDSVGALGDTT